VSGLFSTHLLSLDALLTVVDSIEQHCHSRILKFTTNPSHGGDQTKKGTDSGEGPTTTAETEKDEGGAMTSQKMPQTQGRYLSCLYFFCVICTYNYVLYEESFLQVVFIL
jgi:brefeldin A-resistance guanine nucleotide exchange factor 1